jgi:wyosine [tRNA(Phe)-imidazoG37] synthetase (radical SAM superfamily)
MMHITHKTYQYIYGPVPSWRLGSSLGIDLLSQQTKICTFDCIYCQLGTTKTYSKTRNVYVHAEDVLKELKSLPPDLPINFITFSGRGEPTLASNLGITVKAVRAVHPASIAIITNSSFMNRPSVREELSLADFVIAKLDAFSEETFKTMNRPADKIRFEKVTRGLHEFRTNFNGKLALQIMFTDENKEYAGQIASIAREIVPDEIQLNTPLRPCSTPPLSEDELSHIKSFFAGCNVISIYESNKIHVEPISNADTLRRRGKT